MKSTRGGKRTEAWRRNTHARKSFVAPNANSSHDIRLLAGEQGRKYVHDKEYLQIIL